MTSPDHAHPIHACVYPPLDVRVVTPRLELCGATDALLEDGQPVGMQDLIGNEFASFGTVLTFSWLASDARQRGLGTEMRAAVLHLAFGGRRADITLLGVEECRAALGMPP